MRPRPEYCRTAVLSTPSGQTQGCRCRLCGLSEYSNSMDGRTASHRSARRTARARRPAVATVVCAYACEGLELPDDGLKDLSLHHRLDALVACLQEVLDMPTFSWRACCRLIVLRREQGREWSGSSGMGGREWEWTGRGTIESLKERATLRMLALRSNSNMIDCHFAPIHSRDHTRHRGMQRAI